MKTKKIFLLLLLFASALQVQAQQLGLSSQYYLNDIVINPAVAGVKNFLPVNLSIRRQWTGIKEAPVVQSVSTHGYAGMNLGCGGFVLNEVTGPTRRTAINFATAYHLVLDKEGMEAPRVLSFGLAANLSQHYYNINRMTTYEQEDLTTYNSLNYQLIPDANFGIYYSRDNHYYAGFSVHHLLQTRRDLFEVVTPFDNGFKRNYYLTGGYNYELKKGLLELQPSMMFQMIEAVPFQVEINSRLMYKKTYWLSLGYRYKEAIVAAWGLQMNIFRLSYSYDISMSKLKYYNNGSHEISFSVLLKKYGNAVGGGGKKRWHKSGGIKVTVMNDDAYEEEKNDARSN